MSINLGDEVRDIITGFTGFVVGRREFLSDGESFAVQPQCDGNSYHETVWLKPCQLCVIGAIPPEVLIQLYGVEFPAIKTKAAK